MKPTHPQSNPNEPYVYGLDPSILQICRDPKLILDENASIRFANDAFLSLTGISESDLLGEPFTQIARLGCSLPLDIQTLNTVEKIEVYLPVFQSAPQPYQVSVSPFPNKHSFLLSFAKKPPNSSNEPSLVCRYNQLTTAAHIGKIGYWEYDVESGFFTFNDPFYAIFGTTAADVGSYRLSYDQYLQKFLPPEDRPYAQTLLESVLETTNDGFFDSIEHRMLYANGEPGHIQVHIYVTKDEHGKTIRTFGANQDITALKKAERRLTNLNQLLQSVREVNRLIASERDPNGLARKTAFQLVQKRGFLDAWIALPVPESQRFNLITAKPTSPSNNELICPDILSLLRQIESDASALAEASESTSRFDFSARDSQLSSLCIPLKHKEALQGFLVVTADQHSLVRTEQEQLCSELADDLAFAFHSMQIEAERARTLAELREAKEIAEKSAKAKEEFLAVMSHEIRSPLNPILGYTHLLREKKTDKIDRLYLDSINRAAKQQLNLIDQILQYSRIDRGRIEPHWETFSPYHFFKDNLRDLASTRKDLEIQFSNQPGLPPIPSDLIVESDPSMLQEILSNLLNNASKYTKRGYITVKAGFKQDQNRKCRLICSVEDSGIGIDRETQSRLFTPFTQEDTSYTRTFDGAGLGLAICKRLIDILEGTIGVISEPGEGSRFWFEIPVHCRENCLNQGARPEGTAAGLEKLRSLRVLIVEDREDNADFLQFLMSHHGAESQIVYNGSDAVSLCQEQAFDLILMDIAMPKMNGIEASEHIRRASPSNRNTPIIAITADSSPNLAQYCRACGIQGLVIKPIDISELAKSLTEVIS